MLETKVIDLGKEFTIAEIMEILEAVGKNFGWGREKFPNPSKSIAAKPVLYKPEMHEDITCSLKQVSDKISVFALKFKSRSEDTGYSVYTFLPHQHEHASLSFFVNHKHENGITQLRYSFHIFDRDDRKQKSFEEKVEEFLLNFGIACLLYENK